MKPTAVHLPLEEARRLVSWAIVGSPAYGGPAAEEAGLFRARGRVLAGPVLAPEDVPAFRRSTVDGYAVIAADTFGASEGAPALLELAGRVPAGRPADLRLRPGSCAAVATGAMLPEEADAVVMVEHTGEAGPDLVEVRRPVAPGENVVRPGEDVAAGSEVLRAGRRLTAFDLGLLAALGLTRVAVRPRPRVSVLPTGDEVVPPQAGPLAPGQVRDCVSAPLAELVRSDGGDPVVGAVVPDDPTALLAALERACAETDLVFLVGGSSVGARDHTAAALDRLGPPGVLLHG
ncbi:MAG: molybdopterin molybdenumtransferase MoeA, partial [Firmicutes bacterium]|nr:molybdopterin molybdenumtransferase MoeA [Bacillota bacterium]